ncbi:probable acyl-activating enzyme 6 [Cynara cardunculus var. scolymus]|uniref:AMP-binding, conserved site-containing protein n=1 Tax=Cynara cardunculus var. scolymus TaxID=59895 RepID=A0A103YGI1_CYNCS|nr:probable acyl-activating enzyme 6 [Cynara cardunculus var. scolymus]KVI08690.1 AMP-binding, conserved site-containing protein [Cynara cardunculus var. scolymus]
MDQFRPTPPNSTQLTPLTFLDRCATVYGDCASVVYGDITYTWNETRTRCLQLASSISNIGIKRHQVVSVVAPNVPAMYELYFAIPLAGAVINSINTRLDARTVSVILTHSESKLVFVDYQSVSLVLDAISLFSPNTHKPMLVLITDDGPPPQSMTEFRSTYESMVENGDPGFNWVRPVSEWDPITLNYTSGTTSSPKGVVHCHRGMFVIAVDSLIEWSVPKQPVYLWTLPMFHANGWSYTWGMAAVGGTNICLRKFDATVVYDAIDKHGVTHMCGAPVVLNMLSSIPNVKPLKQPVKIMTAGAPPPAAVLARAESLGFIISHGYGLTETGGLVVTCAWKRKWNRLPATERSRLKARQGVRSIGFTDVDVVDPESGVSVTRDGSTLGEVVLRGGCIMLGYLRDPEGTRKSMRENGWFYTGDVAVMHPDGYLEIKDRSKDVIISGGENLSSVEVESVLYTHPAVKEAAVVARADDYWGETPCAFVSLKAEMVGKVKEKELGEYCRGKLPGYMVPKTVVFKEELPKTSTGKIQKFLLREMARRMEPSRNSRM